MATTGEKEQSILESVRTAGQISVDDLSIALGVSPSTVRRYLRRLADQGKLIRTYGGTVATWMIQQAPEAPSLTEKRMIGRAAASMVQDGQTVFVSSGSTTLELARQLTDHEELTVITNDLDSAHLLLDREGIELIVTGGVVRPNSHGLRGHLTQITAKELRADILFIGVRALSVKQGFMSDKVPEQETDRAMLDVADQVVVLADSSKFNNTAPAYLFGVEEVDVLVTDEGIDEETHAQFEENGVRVIAAKNDAEFDGQKRLYE